MTKVAAGRHRSVDEIESLARGRVWTGADAHERGLVDELGGLRTAVQLARKRAGLREDAPVMPALHVPPLARLGRPRNSEDPRAMVGPLWPGLSELSAAFGLPEGLELRMPSLTLR